MYPEDVLFSSTTIDSISKHPEKQGLVTISAHKMSDDVDRGTLNSILKQAQIKD